MRTIVTSFQCFSKFPKLFSLGRFAALGLNLFFITTLINTTLAFSLEYKSEGQIDFANDQRFYKNSPDTIRGALQSPQVSDSEKVRLAKRMVTDPDLPRNLYEILFEKPVHANIKVSEEIILLFIDNRPEHLYRFNSFEATLPILLNAINPQQEYGTIGFERHRSLLSQELKAQILEQACDIAKKSGKGIESLPGGAGSRNQFHEIAASFSKEFIANIMKSANLPENSRNRYRIQASWEMLSAFRELAETLVYLEIAEQSMFINHLIESATNTKSIDQDFKKYRKRLVFAGYQCEAVVANVVSAN